jgi:hypothetical protein
MNNNNVSRREERQLGTTAGSIDAISDWIRCDLLADSESAPKAAASHSLRHLHLPRLAMYRLAWHVLTAQPTTGSLVARARNDSQQALDESTSSSSPPTTLHEHYECALYLQLFEHALHQAPTVTVRNGLGEWRTPRRHNTAGHVCRPHDNQSTASQQHDE